MDAATAFGMALQGEMVVHAMLKTAAGHQLIAVFERAPAVVAADRAQLQRPIRQPRLQQLRCAIQAETHGTALAVDVGDDQLGLACAVERGAAVELEAPGWQWLAGLADAVDIEIDGGRQHHLARERGQRRGDAIGLQCEVA
ncbi:hypothetical protein D3C81_1481720 [compost metagenome]